MMPYDKLELIDSLSSALNRIKSKVSADTTQRLAFAFFTIISIAWSIIGWKDLNFDQLNYHYFLPYSLLNGRIDQDLLPSNNTSFLNPVAYIPFYWMVHHGWHSITTTVILATVHSINLMVIYKITHNVQATSNGNTVAFPLLASLLAALSPIYLLEVGTSFADVTTSVLVLLAVYYCLKSVDETHWHRSVFIASTCLGAAVGLKLSNVIYGIPFLVMALALQGSMRKLSGVFTIVGLGSIVGLISTQGYWGWQMWIHHHNPFFPFFDNWFNPENFRQEDNANLERFLPEGILDYFTLPFRMLKLRSWIYIENVAPDVRFAALTIIVLIGSFYWLIAKYKDIGRCWKPYSKVVALTMFFLLSYILWLSVSGNARYGMPLMLLCGTMLIIAISRFFGEKMALWSLLIITLMQIQHLSNGDLRWTHGNWTPTWYQASIPDNLKNEPYLYLSIGNNSNSYLFPYLASESAFTNLIGQSSIELTGDIKEKFEELRTKFKGRVKVLARASNAFNNQLDFENWISTTDNLVSRLDYTVNGDSCDWITSDGGAYALDEKFDSKKDRRLRYLVCTVEERQFQYSVEREYMTNIVKKVVSWCPKLFKPARTTLDRTSNGWVATYLATDSQIVIYNGKIIASQSQSAADVLLGTVDDWEQGRTPSCDAIPDKPRKIYTF